MKKSSQLGRYGRTPQCLLADKTISLKAKGIFAFIEDKPDNWEFSVKKLEYLLKEGQEAITSALQELEENHYLERKRYQDGKGYWQVEYILKEHGKSCICKTPIQGNTNTGKHIEHSKTDISKTDISKTDIYISKNKSKGFLEIDLDKFKEIDEFRSKDIELAYRTARDWLASTGKKYKDYEAFFRNWLRRTPDKESILDLDKLKAERIKKEENEKNSSNF